MSKFDMTAQDANNVNSVVYLMSAFGSPALGLIVDKTGRNVLWVMLSIGCTIAAHCILNFTLLNPYIGMVIIIFLELPTFRYRLKNKEVLIYLYIFRFLWVVRIPYWRVVCGRLLHL